MTFLNPAVLFGLFAASIPILLHLLNLRKLKKVEFSTLMFLKELQKQKIRRIKLKQWLLLLLRTLLIIFLVAAFARPTLETLSIGGLASGAKTTAVFILDDTFSMEVVDAKGSYFNQGKQTANTLLNQLQEGDDAAVVKMSGTGSELKLFTDLEIIRDQINGMSLSDVSGTINNAVINAAQLIGMSDNFNKEIYIISDFQKNQINEKDIRDLSDLLTDKVSVYVIDLSDQDVFNAGFEDVKLNTQIFELNKPVNISAVLRNYSDRTIDNAVVSLFINGKRKAQTSIALEGKESGTVELEGIPEEAGFNTAFVEIEDDDISRDNLFYTNFYIPGDLNVHIFADDVNEASYLELALKAADDKAALNITVSNLNKINSYNLNREDVIFCIGGDNLSDATRLRNYYRRGGGLFIMPGANTSLAGFQKLCTGVGLPAADALIEANNEQQPYYFKQLDTDHPLFTDLFEREYDNDVQSPEIFKFYRTNPGGRGKSIITLTDNSAFLSSYEKENGRALLMSVAPVLSASDLPLKGIFAPMVFKALWLLTAKQRSKIHYTVSEPVDIPVEKLTIKQMKIEKPEGRDEIVEIPDDYSYKFYNYQTTDISGNYKFKSNDEIIETASLNIDPAESVTEYMTQEEIKLYFDQINFQGVLNQVDTESNITETIDQARYGSELWKLMLIIALALAVAEMLLARSAKKDTQEVEKGV